MGTFEPSSHNSTELKELKKKLDAALKDNDFIKVRKEESSGYGGYQKGQDGKQENSKESGGLSTNE